MKLLNREALRGHKQWSRTFTLPVPRIMRNTDVLRAAINVQFSRGRRCWTRSINLSREALKLNQNGLDLFSHLIIFVILIWTASGSHSDFCPLSKLFPWLICFFNTMMSERTTYIRHYHDHSAPHYID